MLLVPTFVAQSDVHGLGCFSSQSIPKGTVVYLFDPEQDAVFNKDVLTDHQIEFLLYYGYTLQRTKEIRIPFDNAKFINHSNEPNLIGNIDWDTANADYYIASRDIVAGEELLSNYNEFDDTDQEQYRLSHEK